MVNPVCKLLSHSKMILKLFITFFLFFSFSLSASGQSGDGSVPPPPEPPTNVQTITPDPGAEPGGVIPSTLESSVVPGERPTSSAISPTSIEPGVMAPRQSEVAPVPRPADNTSPDLPEPIETAIPTSLPAPATESSPIGKIATILASILGAGALFAGVSSLIKKTNGNNSEKEKKDSGCLNIKKLMEDKLKELTDLRGKLEGKAVDAVRSEIKSAVSGTVAGDILSAIEKAEKEYGRLKKLYEKCIIDLPKTKRVFIIHGWADNAEVNCTEEGWFPWLKKELENNGFKVFVPQLPDPSTPRIEKWIPAIAEVVATPDEKTYFVGHSMGCQAIARYLETLAENKKVGGAVFVAGFFRRLTGLENDPAVQTTDRHWLNSPIDFAKIKSHLPKSVAIFSDNDPCVPLDNTDDFKNKLGSEVIIEKEQGHFSGSDGTKTLPIALQKIIDLAK